MCPEGGQQKYYCQLCNSLFCENSTVVKNGDCHVHLDLNGEQHELTEIEASQLDQFKIFLTHNLDMQRKLTQGRQLLQNCFTEIMQVIETNLKNKAQRKL